MMLQPAQSSSLLSSYADGWQTQDESGLRSLSSSASGSSNLALSSSLQSHDNYQGTTYSSSTSPFRASSSSFSAFPLSASLQLATLSSVASSSIPPTAFSSSLLYAHSRSPSAALAGNNSELDAELFNILETASRLDGQDRGASSAYLQASASPPLSLSSSHPQKSSSAASSSSALVYLNDQQRFSSPPLTPPPAHGLSFTPPSALHSLSYNPLLPRHDLESSNMSSNLLLDSSSLNLPSLSSSISSTLRSNDSNDPVLRNMPSSSSSSSSSSSASSHLHAAMDYQHSSLTSSSSAIEPDGAAASMPLTASPSMEHLQTMAQHQQLYPMPYAPSSYAPYAQFYNASPPSVASAAASSSPAPPSPSSNRSSSSSSSNAAIHRSSLTDHLTSSPSSSLPRRSHHPFEPGRHSVLTSPYLPSSSSSSSALLALSPLAHAYRYPSATPSAALYSSLNMMAPYGVLAPVVHSASVDEDDEEEPGSKSKRQQQQLEASKFETSSARSSSRLQSRKTRSSSSVASPALTGASSPSLTRPLTSSSPPSSASQSRARKRTNADSIVLEAPPQYLRSVSAKHEHSLASSSSSSTQLEARERERERDKRSKERKRSLAMGSPRGTLDESSVTANLEEDEEDDVDKDVLELTSTGGSESMGTPRMTATHASLFPTGVRSVKPSASSSSSTSSTSKLARKAELARLSRQRKKDYVVEVEARNHQLEARVQELEAQLSGGVAGAKRSMRSREERMRREQQIAIKERLTNLIARSRSSSAVHPFVPPPSSSSSSPHDASAALITQLNQQATAAAGASNLLTPSAIAAEQARMDEAFLAASITSPALLGVVPELLMPPAPPSSSPASVPEGASSSSSNSSSSSSAAAAVPGSPSIPLTPAEHSELHALVTRFVFNSRERQSHVDHHFDGVQQCLTPGLQVKFAMWGLDQPDEFYRPGQGLWYSLMSTEVGLNDAQLQWIMNKRAAMHQERKNLATCEAMLRETRGAVHMHLHSLHGHMDDLLSVMTPLQLAKFYLWVENNSWILSSSSFDTVMRQSL